MLPKILPAGNMPRMNFCEALGISKANARGEKKGPAFARPMAIVGTEWCRWQEGWTYKIVAEDLLADDWAFFEPVVTPIGNLHDLVAQVCGGDCDPE